MSRGSAGVGELDRYEGLKAGGCGCVVAGDTSQVMRGVITCVQGFTLPPKKPLFKGFEV